MGDLTRPLAGASPLDSPRLRAQAGAAMWGAGGLFCLFATVFPAESGWRPGTGAVAAACIVSAIAAQVTGERWSFRFWVVLRLFSNLFVGVAVYSMGASPDGGEIFYLWTILFAFIFFSRRQGIFQTSQAGAMLAVNFALRPPGISPVELWVLFIGSFTGAGLVVASLKERLETVLHQNRLDAVTDSLTGLGNRRRLADDLDRQVFGLREGSRVTLALLDLDGFKSYNDRFGHLAGDALLARFGARLCDALGRSGEAYRFGGDEFCVIVRASSSEHHDAVVTRARDALREVGDGFDVSASCGVVEAPGDGREPLELLQLADSRLYADKSLRGERAAA